MNNMSLIKYIKSAWVCKQKDFNEQMDFYIVELGLNSSLLLTSFLYFVSQCSHLKNRDHDT